MIHAFNSILMIMALSVINSSSPVSRLSVQNPTLNPHITTVAPPVHQSLIPEIPHSQPVPQISRTVISQPRSPIQQPWSIRNLPLGRPIVSRNGEGADQLTTHNLPLQGATSTPEPVYQDNEWLHSEAKPWFPPLLFNGDPRHGIGPLPPSSLVDRVSRYLEQPLQPLKSNFEELPFYSPRSPRTYPYY